MQLEVKLQGLDKVKEKLEKLENIDFEPILSEIGQSIIRTTKKSFKTKTDPWGKAWKALNPATVKAKGGKEDGILYREGTMQGSLTFVLGHNSVSVGVNAKSAGKDDEEGYNYPAVHQFGSKDRKIPKRAFLPVDINGNLETEVQEEIEGSLEDFLNSYLK